MKNMKVLFKYIKGSWGLAILSLIFALLSVAFKLGIPLVAGFAIDQIKGGSYDISLHLVLIACFLVLGSLFRYFFDLFTAYLGQKIVKSMRDQAFGSICGSSLSYIDSHSHGDLLLRLVNDIENVQNGLISGAGALYEGIVQILITLVFMFFLNWVLALCVIILTPLSILVSRFVARHNSLYFKKQNEQTGKLTSFSLESLNNLEAVKAYGMEEQRSKDFDQINQGLRSSNFKATFAVSWINPSTRLVNNTIYASIALLGALLIINPVGFLGIGSFGVGGLTAFLSYTSQYMTPFNEISNVASEVSYALASLSRVDELIQNKKDPDEGKEVLSKAVDSLKADHIDFSYDESRPIIKDFSVDIYKGHKIAIVGPTGSGKTTLINLLLRFYDPQNGCFEINGEPTNRFTKKSLRSHIGMVLQDPWLFDGSVRDNIAYGNPSAPIDEVKEAAKKAQADDFIKQLPQGYDTGINNSSSLSLGQKQLICVARIMLIQPELVILDEATSSIDLRTELLLSKSFDELMKGKTSLVVAHRLSTIKDADLILVLKDGCLIEQGNFQELMTKNGFFKGLFEAQFA